MIRGLKVIVLVVVLVVAVTAVYQNVPEFQESITLKLNLHFWAWSTSIPFYLLFPITFVAGLVVMYLVNLGMILRLKRQIKNLGGMGEEGGRLAVRAAETSEGAELDREEDGSEAREPQHA